MKFLGTKSILIIGVPIDCEWTDWEMGSCSKSCDGGTRTKIRTKQRQETNGGKCDGLSTAQEACNTEGCLGMRKFHNEFIYNTLFYSNVYTIIQMKINIDFQKKLNQN